MRRSLFLTAVAGLSLAFFATRSESATAAAKGAPKVVNDGHGDFLYVPAGAFKMGDNFGDGMPRERPVHTVDVDAFYVGKYEITNAEWTAFRNSPDYDEESLWPGHSAKPKNQITNRTQPQNHGGGTPGTENYPVLGVNWDGAVAYCNWLTKITGKKYRLPTEAEWEKAARGTDQRRYPWGNTIDHSYANYVGAQKFDTGMIVGTFDGGTHDGLQTHNGASPYGAMDMAGNVMEWCSDWYSENYYSVSPAKNPKGPATGAYKVLRGGTFFEEPFDLRTYARSAAWPSLQSHRMIGFRLVREP